MQLRAPHLWILSALLTAGLLVPAPARAEGKKSRVYVRSDWQKTYLHYQGGRGWTQAPGKLLRNLGTGWARGEAHGLRQFVTTDGQGRWGHAATGGNHQVRPGLAEYWVEHGKVSAAPAGAGKLETIQLPSVTLGGTRPVSIYLPAGYGIDPDKRYPVLYLQDGQNLFGRGGWDVGGAIEKETRAGRARQAIVVGVHHAGVGRIREYSPSVDREIGEGGGADGFLHFLTSELKPFIDSRLRTLTDAKHTVIGGSSMGGLMALHAGLKRPDVFGAVLAMSPSLWWNEREMLNRFRALPSKPSFHLYLDSGGAGSSNDGRENVFALRDILAQKGMTFGRDLHHWYEASHPHSEGAWQLRFPRAYSTLFPATLAE